LKLLILSTILYFNYALLLFVGKPEGRRPLGRSRRRWLNNVGMDLVEVRWGDVDWIGLAQDRDRWRTLVNSVLSLLVSYNAGKLPSVLITEEVLPETSGT
jgi:hypothetical protein